MATWANRTELAELHPLPSMVQQQWGIGHWSRLFEYPWVLKHGDFQSGQLVLDAAGGDTPFQAYLGGVVGRVVNVDLEIARLIEAREKYGLWPGWKNVVQENGDLRDLWFPDGTFDRVTCISVLEHIEKPETVVTELLRVLKPGGKLLVTMDVASYARWNHTISPVTAMNLLETVGQHLPSIPDDVMQMQFPEIRPTIDEPKSVALRVLCWEVTKG